MVLDLLKYEKAIVSVDGKKINHNNERSSQDDEKSNA